MLGQKLLIDAVIKALGKKSRKKMEELENRIEKLENNCKCKEAMKEKWYDK